MHLRFDRPGESQEAIDGKRKAYLFLGPKQAAVSYS